MPAPATTDIERLLLPISAGAPAGASLRGESTYDRLREARREDDPSIPQGVWQRPLKSADYNTVVTVAVEALERSKDLQIAAWLADAWAYLYGVQGLARGLELFAGLLERFWDGLFPELPPDGDDEARGRILGWLDDALVRRLRLAKLGDDRVSLTFAEWERAETGGGGDGGPGTTREGLLAKTSLVGAARWAAMHGELSAALAATLAVERAAAKIKSAPPLRALEATLRAVQALARDVLQAAGGSIETPMGTAESMGSSEERRDAGVQGTTAPEHATHATLATTGPITSRADAYGRLTEAADYLLRTEPHSPVPYLIKRAISWGNMPLAELLQEFISGADDLVTTHRLLGMRSRED
jgi:type VI secretion system protein ImpA